MTTVGSGLKAMLTTSDTHHLSGSGAADGTPLRRQLGVSTDDAAIFLEDTVDRATAQCIDASPSALAILTPQRLPSIVHAHVDVTEYDASHLGSLARAGRRSAGENAGSHGGSSSKGRPSGLRAALHDVTNTAGTKLNFSAGTASKSPTPKAAGRVSSASRLRHSAARADSHHSAVSSSTHSTPRRSPSAAEPTVPLADYEALQRERNRFEKMYEHQRVLYEEMAEKQAETYQSLQDKIIEVVALSTRNEESKRFIRQLKREFSESRTRVMDMQNRALEEAKSERALKQRYEALIMEHERKYDRLAERHETKLAGMESLVKDLTCLRGDQDQLHVSQLDSLLKAAYSKSTALFSDLMRQGRQIDLLYDAKCDLESQLEQLRREKREAEAAVREERRRMMAETERLIEQIEDQQQSILNLRQMLIRTMDNRDNVFAYSRGPRRETRAAPHYRADRHSAAEGDEGEGHDDGHHSSGGSSFSSSPSSIAAEDAAERSFGLDDDDSDDTPLHRETGGEGLVKKTVAAAGEREGEAEYGSPDPQPLFTLPRASRGGGQSRPVISAATAAPVLTSHAVVSSTRRVAAAASATAVVAVPSAQTRVPVDVPPLPLQARGGGAAGVEKKRAGEGRQEQPYRIQRGGEGDENSEGRRSRGRDGERGGGLKDSHRTAPSKSATAAAATTPESPALPSTSVAGDKDERASPSPQSAGGVSRRRLDFSTALAAVTEKRRRDRAAREEEEEGGAAADGKHGTSASSNSGGGGGGGSGVHAVPVRVDAGKENGSRGIVRSGAVGSIPTARTVAGPAAHDDDEEEEPRLFQRAGLSSRT